MILLKKSFAVYLIFTVLCCLAGRLYAASGDIIQSSNDKRQYQYLSLENGLRVVLVHDETLDKTAISLDVNVGSSDDPSYRFGLAHFLEHMLFLGTRKYPKAGEFQDFVGGHGGAHNAFTSAEHTNYFFDINDEDFEEALDRFSQFFIAPTLDERYIERERHAVDSEFSSKINSDYRRAADVLRELVVPGHALSRFSTGNLETLSLESVEIKTGQVVSQTSDLKQDVKSFYEQYYFAKNMTLAVVSPRPLAQLKSLVETYFVDVPSKSRQQTFKPSLTDDVFPIGFLPAEVHIVPVKETHSVTFRFLIPDARSFYKKKPLIFLGHLLGHEGEGALLPALKARGWATALSAGQDGGMRWDNGGFFYVDTHLTPDGMAHIPQIKAMMFHYIDKIKKSGLNAWRYEELRKLGEIDFNFSEKTDSTHFVIGLAGALHRYEVSDILKAGYLYDEFDVPLVKQFLNALTPDNLLVTVVSPQLQTDKTTKYYGTSYRVVDSPEKSLAFSPFKRDASLFSSLSLPEKNVYLPSDFELVSRSTTSQVQKAASNPELIETSDQHTLWFSNRDAFDVPKGSVYVDYNMPYAFTSVEATAAQRIMIRIVNEYLNKEVYAASIAGLSFRLHASSLGMQIQWHGYSDTLDVLIETVTRVLKRYQSSASFRKQLNQEYFSHVKREYLQKINNLRFEQSYQQLMGDVSRLLYSPSWPVDGLKKAIEGMDEPTFTRQYARQLFLDVRTTAMVFGNFNVEKAKKIGQHIKSFTPVLDKSLVKLQAKVADVSVAASPLIKPLQVEHKDHALALYVQGDDASLSTKAKYMLMGQMLSAPFYHTLRTEKQLGYVVFGSSYNLRDVPGLIAVVQSPRSNPGEILQEIEAFFAERRAETFKHFERDRQSLIARINEKVKNQAELASEKWFSIFSGDLTFDRKARLVAALQSVDPLEMQKLYDDIFIGSERRILFATSVEGLKPTAGQGVDSYSIFDHQLFYPVSY